MCHENINENYENLRNNLDRHFDHLVDILNQRRRDLFAVLLTQKERKKLSLKDQIAKCTLHLNKATA